MERIRKIDRHHVDACHGVVVDGPNGGLGTNDSRVAAGLLIAHRQLCRSSAPAPSHSPLSRHGQVVSEGIASPPASPASILKFETPADRLDDRAESGGRAKPGS